MPYCHDFKERRSPQRLRSTPLRRRTAHTVVVHERRRQFDAPDIAGMLELNLDRFRTKAAMIEFLQDMLITLGSRQSAIWADAYTAALQKALATVHRFESPIEAVASLNGCQRLNQLTSLSSNAEGLLTS